ncbi:MAG TPA: ankyrin repeat domain-containing protein [Steroidobacteraceae bacterium]|nr:ankyrin repeat domain-containing protein [Steroidobacteraceae bacterium]
MTSKDSNQDQELLDRYRRASDTDAAAPSDAVRSAILAESRRMAEQLAATHPAAKESPPFDVSRPAANDSRWKITAFGTAGAALLAALLIAPRYWESLPPAQQRTASATAPTAAPAAAAESKSTNSDAAAPAPKLESIAPSGRSESSQETAALQENPVLLDKKNAKPAAPSYAPAQNYAPAPPVALQPARPAPSAPSASAAQNELSADRSGPAAQGGLSIGAARAARERNALEPINLQSAAAAGDVAQTTMLLDQGAAVDARDSLGRTPLLLAVAQNRLEVVRLLLARGADPNAADNAGLTPLQQANNKDLRDVAALLQRAGAR